MKNIMFNKTDESSVGTYIKYETDSATSFKQLSLGHYFKPMRKQFSELKN